MTDLLSILAFLTPANIDKLIPLILVLGFVVLVLFFISKFSKKHIALKLGVFSVEFGKEYQKAAEPVENLEAKTAIQKLEIYKRNRTVTFDKLRTFIQSRDRKIAKLHQEILARQFNFCDEKLVEMLDIFMDEYCGKLVKRLSPDIDARSHSSFRTYRMMVELMLEDCVKDRTFGKSIRINHLADLTMDNWEAFVEQKVNVTFGMIKSFYDDNYPDESLVPRKELDEEGRAFEKIRPLIISMYRKAREISIETKAKIKYTEEEIDRVITNETFDSCCLIEDIDD